LDWASLAREIRLLSIIPDWQELLSGDLSVEEYETLRRHERSGRPLGSDGFMVRLEKLTSRVLRRKKPGPEKR